MVMFYDEYSSVAFTSVIERFLSPEFVQMSSAQIGFNQLSTPQNNNGIVQSPSAQFIQPRVGQMPKILEMTTLSNHIEILCRCKNCEERMFYILYAHKEHLSFKEMQRCISNQTYTRKIISNTIRNPLKFVRVTTILYICA